MTTTSASRRQSLGNRLDPPTPASTLPALPAQPTPPSSTYVPPTSHLVPPFHLRSLRNPRAPGRARWISRRGDQAGDLRDRVPAREGGWSGDTWSSQALSIASSSSTSSTTTTTSTTTTRGTAPATTRLELDHLALLRRRGRVRAPQVDERFLPKIVTRPEVRVAHPARVELHLRGAAAGLCAGLLACWCVDVQGCLGVY